MPIASPQMIGTMSGAPLVAGVTLIGGASGALTYEPAQGTIITNPIIMSGGVAVARWDSSGNMILKRTVTASGAV